MLHPSATTAPHTNVDILLVGGDAETTTCCAVLLRAQGWCVSAVSTLPPVTQRHPPRLIVLCGWSIVRAFIAQPRRRVPACNTVVVAYCPPQTDLTAAAFDGGVDAVIIQPCAPELFVRRLRSALRWTAPRRTAYPEAPCQSSVRVAPS